MNIDYYGKILWDYHRLNEDVKKSIDVIEYLVTKKVNMIGIDTLGLGLRRNHGVIDDYLTENKIYGIENLCNLKNIPTKDFKVYCLPIKVEGIYAQPARVLVEF